MRSLLDSGWAERLFANPAVVVSQENQAV